MKKPAYSHIGSLIKRIFNVRWWVDYDRLRGFAEYLLNVLKHFFVPQQKTADKSFETAVKELHLSEEDLLVKEKSLYRLSLIMSLFALALFFYAGYLLFYGTIKATIVSIVIMIVALTLAFRYHFWYFQIKERKLGCTLKEWYRFGLRGDKHE